MCSSLRRSPSISAVTMSEIEVVGGVGLAVLDDGGEVLAHGRRRRGGHRVVVGPLVHVEGPGVEPLVVLGRHAQHARR